MDHIFVVFLTCDTAFVVLRSFNVVDKPDVS